MSKAIRVMILLGVLLLSGIGAAAQQEEQTIEDRLVSFTHQLRMSLTLATVAAYSPTIIDLHLHAQQLVNLLEGPEGSHYALPAVTAEIPSGLLREMVRMRTRIELSQLEGETLARVKTSANNVYTYLEFALSAALEGLDQRGMGTASSDMLRAYAFLLAAYEIPCDVTYVPALWTILRAYNLTGRFETSEDR